jgi:hypothetical protein
MLDSQDAEIKKKKVEKTRGASSYMPSTSSMASQQPTSFLLSLLPLLFHVTAQLTFPFFFSSFSLLSPLLRHSLTSCCCP